MTITVSGESFAEILFQLKPAMPVATPEAKLDAMSLQELLLYADGRCQAEGYDMTVTRPGETQADRKKEEARAKLRGDLEASVKEVEKTFVADVNANKNVKAPAKAEPEPEGEPEAETPKKSKAKANGKAAKVDPAEVKKGCIADLHKLYSEGHKDKVNKILADFGAGAKNFNSIPDEQFVPIREAIEALKL